MRSLSKAQEERVKEFIRELYGERCVRCHKPNVRSVHEIYNKTLRPDDWWEFDNMVVLCGECHIGWAHKVGVDIAAPVLIQCRHVALMGG